MDDNMLFGVKTTEIYDYISHLCEVSGYEISVGHELFAELKKNDHAMEEFVYYYQNEKCLCKYTIGEYSIADIMIWQMDHFRAHMDRLDNYNRYNNGSLVICTFITFLWGYNNPQELARRISSETGTDLSSGWTIG